MYRLDILRLTRMAMGYKSLGELVMELVGKVSFNAL